MHFSRQIILVIILISPIFVVNGAFYQHKQNGEDAIQKSAYTLVSPIFIDGNFSSTATLMGWVGDGSASSPYIIENIEVQGTEFDTLITIANTGDYFTIKNSVIQGGDRGIFLDNADRGLITSNIISNNTSHGIVLASASRVNITNNEISFNGNGVFSFNPFLIIVNGNEIHHNTLVGVDLEQSSNNTVSNNDVYHNPIGILMSFQSQSLTQSSYVLHNNVHDNTEQGIYLDRSKIVQVYNNTVFRNGDGILNNAGEDNHIYENLIENNRYGVYVIGGLQDTNNMHDNTLLLNGFFITESVADSSNWYFYHNIRSLDSNTVNGKPVGYFNHTSGLTLSTSDYGQIILINASQTVIENQDILAGSIGIEIEHSDNVVIKNSVFQNNTVGVGIYYSSNITISNNIIDGGKEIGVDILTSSNVNITSNDISRYSEGIHSTENDNSEITNNTIHNNGNDGIFISASTNMIIYRNFVHTNGYGSTYAPTPLSGIQLNFEVENPTYLENNGVYCDQMSNTEINSNTFYNNRGYGFYGEFSCNGDLYQNDFVDNNRTKALHPNSTNTFNIPESNTHEVISTHDTPQIFVWHNETIIENFFSDADFEDTDEDGLGDIPYELQEDQFGDLLETLSVTNPYGWHHAISKPTITKAIFLPEGGVTVFWDKSEDTLQHELIYTIVIRLIKNNLDARTQTGISVADPDIKNIEGTIDIIGLPNLFYYLEVYAEDSDGLRSESSYMSIELSEIISGTWVPVTDKTSTAKGDFNPDTIQHDFENTDSDRIGIGDDDEDDKVTGGFLSFSFKESFVLLAFIFYINIVIRRRKE